MKTQPPAVMPVSHTTGHKNIAVGYGAGDLLTTGDNNIAIGKSRHRWGIKYDSHRQFNCAQRCLHRRDKWMDKSSGNPVFIDVTASSALPVLQV